MTTKTSTTQPPATSITQAESKRGSHLLRLRHDLDVASRSMLPFGAGQEEMVRQAKVREQVTADIEAKIAFFEGLEGRELCEQYGIGT